MYHVDYQCTSTVQLRGFRPINDPQHPNYRVSTGPAEITATSFIKTDENGNAPEVYTVDQSTPRAVDLKDVYFYYGRTANPKVILNGINLSVPQGAIYGLLGPSGCGKTTLLRCIVGSLSPNFGTVTVLGYQPGDPRAIVPGPGVGYMPQDIALYEDFTIREMLQYFGRLFQLKRKVLRDRMDFLLEFLDLPNESRRVGTLSGGQKRRVSLAVALVHKPPLVILDEPTVGVDPLLRRNIWLHLRTLSAKEKITVIISTHYIEEARGAQIVGLMRSGRLMAQESPEMLLEKHQSVSIEEVFLNLCKSNIKPPTTSSTHAYHHHGSSSSSLAFDHQQAELRDKILELKFNQEREMRKSKKRPVQGLALKRRDMSLSEYWAIVAALFWKSFLRNLKNIPALLFQFVLPAFQVVLFCVCIGSDPFHIPVGIVNMEKCCLSEVFLSHVDPYMVIQRPYDRLDKALEDVKTRELWGVVHIRKQFTDALQMRLQYRDQDVIKNATITGSEIKIYADLTDRLTAIAMYKTFDSALNELMREALDHFGSNPAIAQSPVIIKKPVYGTLKNDNEHHWYTEYMAPGIILTMTYAMAVGMTSMTFILERRDGMLERTLVAGVDTTQILVAHAMVRIILMTIQVILVLIVTFIVFAIPSRGPIGWVIILLVVQNLTGMALGFVIAAMCRQEQTSTMLTIGLLFVNLYLGGVIWPIEAMPKWLRWFAYMQPHTIPAEALRNILLRGWSIDRMGVWMGFVVCTTWFIVFSFVAAKVFRFCK